MAIVESQVVTDDPYVRLSMDLDRSIVRVEWKRYPPTEIYRNTLERALHLIRDRALQFFLTDQRRRGAILREDERWLLDDWSPRMAGAGLRGAAIVQSADFFNMTAIDRMVARVVETTPYPIAFFKDIEAATEWLGTKRAMPA